MNKISLYLHKHSKTLENLNINKLKDTNFKPKLTCSHDQ